MLEQTLSIIKPDGVARNLIGKIISSFESSGLRVVAMKMLWLSINQARQFYFVHKDRPFYEDLVSYMISGPVVTMVLEGENAVARNREIMGATNPKDAKEGTIRKAYALSVEKNTVHGSDSPENAEKEIQFFFSKSSIYNL